MPASGAGFAHEEPIIDPRLVRQLRSQARKEEPVEALPLGLGLGLSRSQVEASVSLCERWGYLRRHAGVQMPVSLTDHGRRHKRWSDPA